MVDVGNDRKIANVILTFGFLHVYNRTFPISVETIVFYCILYYIFRALARALQYFSAKKEEKKIQ
jgi:hypothetical protein